MKRDIVDRKGRRKAAMLFLDEIERREGLLDTFDEMLWNISVQRMTVLPDGGTVFVLADGSEYALRCI